MIMTIHVVIGTKAQLVKMAPIMVNLQERNIPYNFIYTSQHKEKMGDLLANFGLKNPDYIMHQGRKDVSSVKQMFFWLLRCLFEFARKKSEIFGKTKTGIVLVHGDTFSTLLGALMGRLARLEVGHVESGLRSFNFFHPFPEEIIRFITVKLAQYYFCPGEWAVHNLRKEKGVKINVQQNTLLDSLRIALQGSDGLNVDIPDGKYGLVSLHRFENIFNARSLKRCIEIIEIIAQYYPLLFILHIPTMNKLKEFGFYERLEKNPNIGLRPRYDYFDFIALLNKSRFLITDGGSNQEECYYMNLPCLLLRKATERLEGLDNNVILSGYRLSKVHEFMKKLEHFERPHLQMNFSPSTIAVDACLAMDP
jgi:UDP-N-acetylglucosamine 2-epimerase (non-hydrolysing)